MKTMKDKILTIAVYVWMAVTIGTIIYAYTI